MKINKKVLNWSIWLTLLMTYVLPYQSQSKDGFSTNFGYPFPFFTVYKTPIQTSLLMSRTISLMPLILNITIIYFAIKFADKLLIKKKDK
jgi:hypothetical protein